MSRHHQPYEGNNGYGPSRGSDRYNSSSYRDDPVGDSGARHHMHRDRYNHYNGGYNHHGNNNDYYGRSGSGHSRHSQRSNYHNNERNYQNRYDNNRNNNGYHDRYNDNNNNRGRERTRDFDHNNSYTQSHGPPGNRSYANFNNNGNYHNNNNSSYHNQNYNNQAQARGRQRGERGQGGSRYSSSVSAANPRENGANRYTEPPNQTLCEMVQDLQITQLNDTRKKFEAMNKYIIVDNGNQVEYAESRFSDGKYKKINSDSNNKYPSILNESQLLDNEHAKKIEFYSREDWIKAAAKPISDKVSLSFQNEMHVACNALPLGKCYNLITKYSVEITPQVNNEEDRRSLIYNRKIKSQISKCIHPWVYDNKHIFSFCNNNNKIEDSKQIIIKHSTDAFNNNNNNENKNNDNNGEIDVETEYIIKLINVKKIELTPEKLKHEMGLSFIEMGLNILNRERFAKYEFGKFFRKNVYYSKKANCMQHLIIQRQPPNHSGKMMLYPDLTLLAGYLTSTHSCKNNIMVKTALQYKAVTTKPLSDLCDQYEIDDIKDFFKPQIASNGRKQHFTGVTTYGKEFIRIEGITTSVHLDSTFEVGRGNNAKKITYREYYNDKIKKLGLPGQLKEERFFVKYEDNFYLPQFILLCANNTIQTDYARNEIRNKYSNVSVSDTIFEALKINVTLNQKARDLQKIFETNIDRSSNNDLKPYIVKAYQLNDPSINIDGGKLNGSNLTCIAWKNTIKGLTAPPWDNTAANNHSNNDNSKYKTLNWAIVFDGHRHQTQADIIVKNFSDFLRQRGFSPQPLNTPDLIATDMDNLDYIRDVIKNNDKEYCTALFIIENDQTGSKTKIDITRFINFENTPKYTLTKGDNSNSYSHVGSSLHANNGNKLNNQLIRIDTQFITQGQLFGKNARNATFGVFEAILQKAGFQMYEINPMLPPIPASNNNNNNNSIFETSHFPVSRTWVIGIKVDSSKARKNLNTVILSCMQKPMLGSLAWTHSHVSLLSQRSVIPRKLMTKFMIQIVLNGIKMLEKNCSNKGLDSTDLPLNLVFIRKDLPDSEFSNVISKEICSIKRFFDTIKHKSSIKSANNSNDKNDNHNNNNNNNLDDEIEHGMNEIISKLRLITSKDDNSSIRWMPAVTYSVLQDEVIDAFGEWKKNQISTLDKPICVINDVTSGIFSDFFIQLPKQQQKNVWINKQLRYINLSDDIIIESNNSNDKYNIDKQYGSKYRCQLSNYAHLTSDYIQFLYSLHFAYCPNVPFIKGPPDYPAPIKFANHYAQWQNHLIINNDRNLNALKTDENINSSKPKFVTI